MPPTILELLESVKQQDIEVSKSNQEINKRILGAMGAGVAPIIPGVHPSELDLEDPDEDPFGGNINNRNVAERIAKESAKIFGNYSRPIHMGDPAKARLDILQSRRVNPDVPIDDSDEESPVLPPPTPGSPAAVKVSAGAVTAKGASATLTPPTPPTWKPNA